MSTQELKEKDSLQSSASLNVDGFLRMVGGFGRFQWILDAIFCIILIPAAFQSLIMYFGALNPDWKCIDNSTICTLNGTFSSSNEYRCNIPRSEWEFTQPKGYSMVTEFDIYCNSSWTVYMSTSILFIGWLFGAIVLGWLSDNYGRKNILFISVFVMLLFGLIGPFMPNLTLFFICRFFVGFFRPGVSVIMFILISELVGARYRPAAGILFWFFFTIALCIMGLKAYFIRKWKILFIICSAPYFVVLLFYKFVPESVRWLRLKGKFDEALDVFQRIADWNGRKLNPNATVSKIIDEKRSSNPMELFRNKQMAIKTIIQGFAWMVSGMVYYGISLAASDLGGSLYRDYILVSIVEFPAALLAIDFCERFGRRKTVCYSMILAGLLTLIVGFIPLAGGKAARVALGMLGKMFVTLSYDSIYTWSVEIYPTDIRSEGMGFLQITSRIGAASAPWIGKAVAVHHPSLPFIIMGTLGLISGVLTLYLPETKGQETQETDNDVTEEVFFLGEFKSD